MIQDSNAWNQQGKTIDLHYASSICHPSTPSDKVHLFVGLTSNHFMKWVPAHLEQMRLQNYARLLGHGPLDLLKAKRRTTTGCSETPNAPKRTISCWLVNIGKLHESQSFRLPLPLTDYHNQYQGPLHSTRQRSCLGHGLSSCLLAKMADFSPSQEHRNTNKW